jgi:hypothetical protein
MAVHRIKLRSAANLAATVVWTSPNIPILGAQALILYFRASDATVNVAATIAVSNDHGASFTAEANIFAGTNVGMLLLQGDTIHQVALNAAGGKSAQYIANFGGGATPVMAHTHARVKVTGHATTPIAGLEVEAVVVTPHDNLLNAVRELTQQNL